MTNNELTLRYGCNPHQVPAKVYTKSGILPFTVLNGDQDTLTYLMPSIPGSLSKNLSRFSCSQPQPLSNTLALLELPLAAIK